MPHTVALNPPIFHVNTHTFRHRRVFLNPECEAFVKQSFAETARIWDIELIEFEVMPSHVHFLLRIHLDQTLSRVMNLLKGRSSRELALAYPDVFVDMQGHLWSAGYYETRIKSQSQYRNTVKYIREQKIQGGLVDREVDSELGPGSA